MNQQSPTTPYEYKANPRWMGNPVVGEMCEKCFSDVCVSPPQDGQQESQYLQFCRVCQGFKPPRSHHCRKCNRSVTDHTE